MQRLPFETTIEHWKVEKYKSKQTPSSRCEILKPLHGAYKTGFATIDAWDTFLCPFHRLQKDKTSKVSQTIVQRTGAPEELWNAVYRWYWDEMYLSYHLAEDMHILESLEEITRLLHAIEYESISYDTFSIRRGKRDDKVTSYTLVTFGCRRIPPKEIQHKSILGRMRCKLYNFHVSMSYTSTSHLIQHFRRSQKGRMNYKGGSLAD